MNLISLHHDIFFLADSGRIEMTLQSNITMMLRSLCVSRANVTVANGRSKRLGHGR